MTTRNALILCLAAAVSCGTRDVSDSDSIYNDGWGDFNKNGRMDVYENLSVN